MNTSNRQLTAETVSDNQWWSSQSTYELAIPVTTAAPVWPRFFERSLLEADTRPLPLGRLLPMLWAFIGMVCAYDVYLSVKYPDWLRHLEQNPIGNWLLNLDGGDPALFMSVKFFSSMIVLGVLILSHRWYGRLCWVLTSSVALFQCWLGGYLFFA